MGDHSTEVLLSTGIAFHSGGCDKTGHPLVIFPTEYQSALTQTSEEDLLSLLHYFRKIVSDEQRRQGFTFLVNLQKSSTQFITKLVSALNSFQLEVKPEVGVHSLYTIKPKTSKLQAHFEKLTGLKESKKAATANIYQVHILKDFASLHRSVEKVSLTDEFGGHQQFNLPAWIRFRLAVDELTSCVAKCREQIDECRDQLRVLCELEINDDTQSLLDSINSKYTSIMSQLNLDYAIEKCGSMLEELSAGKGQVKVVQGDMLRELVKFTRSSNKQLCEVREDFQLLWRKAQARVVQASQLKVHQKNANKISKWINKSGSVSLAELSRPIRSLEDVTSSRQRLAELSKSCQELEKGASYINTDVEYMALHDASEFTTSFRSIERMTSGLEEFNGSLLNLEEKFNTAATVFSNVEKCYKWYCKFLSFAPQTEIETEFIAECRQYLEGDKGASPPEEWLNYIMQELAAIDNEIYSTNATILIKRIRQIYSLKSDEKRELSLSEVKGWRDYLTEGFDSLHQQKASSSAKKEEADVRQLSSLKKLRAAPKLKGTSVNNESGPIKIKKAVTRVEHGIDESQEEHRNAGSPIHVAENMSSNETQIGSSLEGKLDDSLAGGSKDMLVTAKTQGSALAEGRSALAEGHSVTAEGRPVTAEGHLVTAEGRPVTAEGRPVTAERRPVTADGKNSKLLENTKEVVADKNQNKNPNRSSKKRKQMKRKKAKVEEDDIDDSCPLVDNCLSVCSEVIPNTPQTVNSSKGPTQTTISSKEPNQTTISSKGPNQTTISSKGPDQTTISSKGPNQTISELSAQSSTTQLTKNATPSLVPPDIVAREELNILSLGDYVIPQNYNLPYHPVTNKEKIERICNSASPTPKQKLDMMSQLIEEGDESCFCVRIEKLLNPRERMTPKAGNGTREQTDKWTSVADFSEELSADITYPEHVYHWLSKQNSHAFSSRDNSNNAEDDQNSIKECIRRAERILDEDVPSFTSADLHSGPWRRPGGHTSGAFTVVPSRAPSKSGDSGITDLTSREAPIRVLIGQGQNRYASRESGIDSDATLYTPVEHVTTASRSVRPKEVPPLWSKR